MKLGLYGGSFNPVHNTHLDVARTIGDRLSLDEVLLVPAGDPYHKKTECMLPADIRFELVRVAVQGEKNIGVSDLDLVSDRPTYTVDTLKRARKRYRDAELFFLMGQDSFETLHLWKEWNSLGNLANLVVISRGSEPEKLRKLAVSLFPEAKPEDAGIFKLKSGKKIYLFEDLDFRISATQVRQKWLSGADCSDLLPLSVVQKMQSLRDILASCWEGPR